MMLCDGWFWWFLEWGGWVWVVGGGREGLGEVERLGGYSYLLCVGCSGILECWGLIEVELVGG